MPRLIRYKSLDPSKSEIRVLEVQPAERIEDPAVCRFVHISLNQDIEFIGISALLGDQNATEPIVLDGARISLPENIGQALRHVRAVFPRQGARTSISSLDQQTAQQIKQAPPPPRPKKSPGWLRRLFQGPRSTRLEPSATSQPRGEQPLRIWMDALCINSRDAREVNEQRSTMAAAYRAARMVVGWLGPKDETSDLAVEIIRTVDRAMPANFGTEEDRRLHPENYAPNHVWMAAMAHLWALEPGVTNPIEGRAWKAMSNFLSRTYFQRDWIINEICMATFPAFLLGDEIVSWLEVIRWNRSNEELIDSGTALFPDDYRDVIDKFMPLASVYTLLREFEKRKAAGTLQLGLPPTPRTNSFSTGGSR
ncbi:hypothetical protein GQ53DRAFT_745976 [Thozetella sp. PMI_491]|nr:hypothetical protein GQ53DRAFT_745976 [Thozetella sp. PMI_491]